MPQASDTISTDDRGAVEANKALRVQSIFQALDRMQQQV